MSEIGIVVKEARKKMGLSQKKLAKICNLSDSDVCNIENGKRQAGWEILCRLAKGLSLHPLELLLAGGYITEEDVHPSIRLHGLTQLSAEDLSYLQLFVDGILAKKTDGADFKEADDDAI